MPIKYVQARLSCELCATEWHVRLDTASSEGVVEAITRAIEERGDQGFERDGAFYCVGCDMAFYDHLEEEADGPYDQLPRDEAEALAEREWDWFAKNRQCE